MKKLVLKRLRAMTGAVRNAFGLLTPRLTYAVEHKPTATPRVLVVGIYLADRPNTLSHLIEEFRSAERCEVKQLWCKMGPGDVPAFAERDTVFRSDGFVPKFVMLNRMLKSEQLDDYDHVIVTDDDVRFRSGFVDCYIGLHERCGLSLSQPARTFNSYITYRITRRQPFANVRRTRFVEIGPVFCISRSAYAWLLPFDESSGMGYGYDLVWPELMRKAGLLMGVTDACPIDHSIRRVGSGYSQGLELKRMHEYLARNPHMPLDQALAEDVKIL